MRRAKGLFTCLSHMNSFLLPQSTTARSLHIQVTHYFHLFPCIFSSINHAFLNTHQISYFSSTPNSAIDLIFTNKWSAKLEHQLEKSNPPVTNETIVYVLNKLKLDQKACDFIYWVSTQNGFKPNYIVYNLILDVFVRIKSMKDFWLVINQMSEEGYDLDKQTYNKLKAKLGKAKLEKDAAELAEIMKKIPQESPTAATVSKAVEVIVQSDWSNAVENKLKRLNLLENSVLGVFKELQAYPLKALEFFRWTGKNTGNNLHNAVTYNAIVRVIGKEETIQEFWSLVKEMKRAGYDMDISTYVKVSRQFRKGNMMKDGVKLYEFMMDGPYKPSVQDCGALLRHIALRNMLDLGLFFRVVKKYDATGQPLPVSVYDEIHKSLTSLGRFDEAEKILKAMKHSYNESKNVADGDAVGGRNTSKHENGRNVKVGQFGDRNTSKHENSRNVNVSQFGDRNTSKHVNSQNVKAGQFQSGSNQRQDRLRQTQKKDNGSRSNKPAQRPRQPTKRP